MKNVFARNYARGKFRIKNWGKRKIVYELKLLQISDYCIKKGLEEIDPEEYEITLAKLGHQKWVELKKIQRQWVGSKDLICMSAQVS